MKTAPKIILLVFAILQFLIVLYISYPSIPMPIGHDSNGQTYSFMNINFDLENKDLQKNLEFYESSGLSEDEIYVLTDTQDNRLTIITNDQNISFNQTLRLLKNPFERIRLENASRELIPENSEVLQDTELKVKRVRYSLHKKEPFTFILQHITYENADSITILDFDVDKISYTLIYSGENSKQNVNHFMKTVNIL